MKNELGFELIEERVSFTVANGQTMGAVETNTSSDGTDVVRVVVFHGAFNNTSMVDLSIQANGVEVSKLQHIDNYRSREAGYLDNKHCHFPSGQKVRIEVRAESAFTGDFKGQVIFIKRKRC